ncbi:MAG: hypothetical protein GY810_00010 [Aureispira sp.]|nr:hypothetical protein [Aureispira sp.]
MKQKDFIWFLMPLFLGSLSLLIWLYEINSIIGWNSLEWLNQELYSIYIITLLVVISYLLPIAKISQVGMARVLVCGLTMYGAAIGGFILARGVFYDLYNKIPESINHYAWSIWKLFAIVLLVAIVFFLLKQWLLDATDRFHILTLIVALIAVVPMSLITVEYIPGFGVEDHFVDAVKMGYPVFWINVLLGITSFFMSRKII